MQWRVAVDDEETTAIFEAGAPRDGQGVFVCAHGAGGHREDRGMVRLAAVLRPRGFDLVRFNFLYRENGSGRPDAMPRLKRCLGAVVARSRKELGPRPPMMRRRGPSSLRVRVTMAARHRFRRGIASGRPEPFSR